MLVRDGSGAETVFHHFERLEHFLLQHNQSICQFNIKAQTEFEPLKDECRIPVTSSWHDDITKVRKDQYLTQWMLPNMTGIRQSRTSQIETGYGGDKLGEVLALSAVLGMAQ